MAKEHLRFCSNDIDQVFNYFKSFETLENIFGIQYAWEDGSFDFDNEVGTIDFDTVMYKGKVYTKPLLLSVQYDDSAELSLRESFSKATVHPTK